MRLTDISKSFQQDETGFTISGVDLTDIVNSSQTPSFVYDAETIREKYSHLRNNLPREVNIFYAMKANPNLAIVRLLTNLGTGVEVASKGELLVCQRLGIEPTNIVFAGPSKTDEDLETAIDMQIYSINAESMGELRRISRIAGTKGYNANVELRVNPEFEINNAVVNMGGGSQKFGIDSEKLPEAIIESLSLPYLNLRGIHVFSATGILNQDGLLRNLENCFDLAEQVNESYPVVSLDVGGGLGIPYKEGQEDLSIEGIGDKISQMMDNHRFIRNNNTRIILEPGRFLVGQSGIYVSRVVDVKDSRGTRYVLTDGGIHHLLRPALLGSSHPVFNLSRDGGETANYDIGGCLCTSTDFLARGARLPRDTMEGDLIGVFCSGAYGFTESMPLFLSHDIPAEVLVNNGSYSIIRERMDIVKVLENQRIPEGI